jgi:hypothetical protein
VLECSSCTSGQTVVHQFDVVSLLCANICSLAVKDLSSIVKPEDIVTSEHLVTLLVVVSRFTEKEWLTSYESLSQFVVSLRSLDQRYLANVCFCGLDEHGS